MSLPGDSRLSRQHSREHSPVEDKGHDRNDDPENGLFENSSSEEKSEVAEDQQARSDVICSGRPQGPERHATDRDDKERAHDEHLSPPDENDASENEKRNRIRDEMAKSQVKKRSGEDPSDAGNGARANPELIKEPSKNEIGNLQPPGDRNQSEQEHQVLANCFGKLVSAMIERQGRRGIHRRQDSPILRVPRYKRAESL